MTRASAGGTIHDLRRRILEAQTDLERLGRPAPEIPEMIDSANLRRANEYLSEADDRKTHLLSLYEQYSAALEEMLRSVFEIQNDLKDILKEQSLMISSARAGKGKAGAPGTRAGKGKTGEPGTRAGKGRAGAPGTRAGKRG